MADKLASVWQDRDFPVLVEIARRFDANPALPAVMVEDLANDLGMTFEEVASAGYALKKRGFVTTGGAAEAPVVYFAGITGDAYLATDLHPDGDDAISDLIDGLRQAADRVDDLDERSRLRRLADTAGGVSRDVLANVLAAVIAKQAGG